MPSILDKLVQFEKEIHYQVSPAPGELEFCYIPGRIPVLLSAPHAAVHTRDGKLKDEDEYTGAITRLIAEVTGAHILYAHRKSGTDPNWYPDVPYKQRLEQIVQSTGIGFVLDVHGASSRRDFGLALGTMMSRSCPAHKDLILDALSAAGFAPEHARLNRLDVDHTFKGAGTDDHETVTAFCWNKIRVPAAQLEINAYLRIVSRKPDASQSDPFYGKPDLIERTVFTLQNLVQTLST